MRLGDELVRWIMAFPLHIDGQDDSVSRFRLSRMVQRFSPWIVATTFLECLAARNSRYQIPCHVPVLKPPLVIGMVTLAPTNADLICA
jgi:hypothetical protein